MDSLSADKETQGVIIKSSNPKVFCAGLDLEFVLTGGAEGIRILGRAFHDLWRSVFTSRLAVINAIEGPSIAGGYLISAASDYRVIKETASVGLTESLLGIVGPWYLRETVTRLIGPKESERMFILGKVHKAPEALKLGLVDEIVPQNESVDQRAVEVMKEWVKIPESGRVYSKLGLRQAVIEYAEKNRQTFEDEFVTGLTSPVMQKTIRTYFEGIKRSKM